MISSERKQAIIRKYQTHKGDTGSAPVQLAVLSEEIMALADHLRFHKKDNSCRLGLLRKINMRRKMTRELKHESRDLYDAYINKATKDWEE